MSTADRCFSLTTLMTAFAILRALAVDHQEGRAPTNSSGGRGTPERTGQELQRRLSRLAGESRYVAGDQIEGAGTESCLETKDRANYGWREPSCFQSRTLLLLRDCQEWNWFATSLRYGVCNFRLGERCWASCVIRDPNMTGSA